MREVALPEASTGPYERLLGADRVAGLRQAAAALGPALRGRTIWHVNSTSTGGGVAEMLHAVLPLARAVGVDCRWLVTEGDAAAHALTKRLCLRLYGSAGDGGPLGEPERRHYARICAAGAARLRTRVRPGDVVVVHDPQPAGLVEPAREQGAAVVWRCHIGSDRPNGHTRQGWRFLRRYVEPAHRLVFSVRRHVPDWAAGDRVRVIPPGVDPCSPKNMPLDEATVVAVLGAAGLVTGPAGGPGGPGDPAQAPLAVPALDGPDIQVRRRARVWRDGAPPPAATPMVVQVSRWDRLKGMDRALHAFAVRGPDAPPACLTLAGPDPAGVADDPEGAAVLEECCRAWAALPPRRRRTIQLACLPMADLRENALVVNALQRHATVVAQLSVAEGFGLTLTEAMWK
ncbi:MAG TPA: hypothetical protein VFM54_06905, partial [Micromonosporaceae bacterium]|nr:hypothetical protein [Micromonosporaceae bacterium]